MIDDAMNYEVVIIHSRPIYVKLLLIQFYYSASSAKQKKLPF